MGVSRNRYQRRAESALSFLAAVAGFLVTLCLFIGLFWWYGRGYARVSLDVTYYFLVRDCEDTTASAVAGQVYLAGGAGYLLEKGGESAVVLACYFKETDADFVRETMSEKGVETQILALSGAEFTLNGDKSSERNRIVSNAATVETCAQILYDTANGLERTDLSQDEARAAVRGAVASLKGLRLENSDGFYESWNYALYDAEKRGTEIAEGILFAKDLRYLQVELCMMIVSANEYFT